MITETVDSVAWCGYWYRDTNTSNPDHMDLVKGRHNEGSNVGFVDGHAKWIKQSNLATTQGYWDSRYSQ